MITTGDVANILYRDARALDIGPVYRTGAIPTGRIDEERVTIHPGRQTEGNYWLKGFVQMNLCVPDVNGMAHTARLTELERIARRHFTRVIGVYDTSRYRYAIDSVGQEADNELQCHFVHVRILFEVLNC